MYSYDPPAKSLREGKRATLRRGGISVKPAFGTYGTI
jgi:hypothetical protein